MSSQPLDIDAVYRQYAPLVYRRILKFYSHMEAEEVLHEVFMKVIERADQFRREASPTTWLYRITTNHCLNRLRDARRRTEILAQGRDELAPPRARPASQLDELFWKQLQQHVDPELLEIAVLYYLDGLNHLEISKLYGVSRRTIGNRLEELGRLANELAEGG